MATIKDTQGSTTKSWRDLLKERQGTPITYAKKTHSNPVLSDKQANPTISPETPEVGHTGINGWSNKSNKHWTEQLKNKNLGQWLTNPVGIVGGRVAEEVRTATDVNTYTEGSNMEGFSLMPLNKLWRVKLVINRAKSSKDKTSSPLSDGGWVPSLFSLKANAKGDPANGVTTKTDPNYQGVKTFNTGKRRYIGRKSIGLTDLDPSVKEDSTPLAPSREVLKKHDDKITKSNPIATDNSVVIISPYTSPYQSITLQCRPDEIQVTPQSTWAAVSSMGRNNPFRMYTGGEDTIQFDICWYCNDPDNRGEVVTKCRLLESWSKANGYLASPPVLQLVWGKSGIYQNDFFILESASYKLSHFQNMAKRAKEGNGEVEYINLCLYPNYATQTLVFKRVSGFNREWKHIVSIEDLRKTRGISVQEKA